MGRVRRAAKALRARSLHPRRGARPGCELALDRDFRASDHSSERRVRLVGHRVLLAVGGPRVESPGAHTRLRAGRVGARLCALARLQISAGGFARGPLIVLWLVLMVCAADIGAYFAGRAFGQRKLAPRVSPGKTWEGAMGGLAMVALVAGAGAVYFGLPPLEIVAFGCGVGIFSVIGDLTESMFKRAAALKDSGTLLPGHGGLLDRIDSVTAAAPLYALGLFGSGVIR